MTHSTREQIGNRTILITVVMNIFLSLIKLRLDSLDIVRQ